MYVISAWLVLSVAKLVRGELIAITGKCSVDGNLLGQSRDKQTFILRGTLSLDRELALVCSRMPQCVLGVLKPSRRTQESPCGRIFARDEGLVWRSEERVR